MAMCTYLHEQEKEMLSKISDKELNELFQEVRKLLGNKHFVKEQTIITKKLFRRKREHTLYCLYYNYSNDNAGCIEVQVINFPPISFEQYDSSINVYTDKSHLMTYFFGLLSNSTKTSSEAQCAVG